MLQTSATMRTREEIDGILEAAKLDRADLLPLSQEILFDSKFGESDIRLIELGGPDILNAVKIGSSLVFRGDVNDAAVLCTDSCTFEIKEAETSNSLLLLKNVAFPDRAETPSPNSSPLAKKPTPCLLVELDPDVAEQEKCVLEKENSMDMECEENLWVEQNKIISIAHSYLELKKIRPNLSRIHSLLSPSKYRGPEYESDQTMQPMTFAELLDRISASSKEIENYLQLIRAFEMNGFIRLVEEEYLFRVVSQILNCIEEHSWGKDDIVKEVVLNSLESSNLHSPVILENVFQWFFITSSSSATLSDESQTQDPNAVSNTYSIKEREMCRFLGEILLKPVGRFNLKDFLKAWQESVPEGLKTNLRQLDGLAVCDTESTPQLIWYFPEYNLPESVADRLTMLFDTKKKWKQEEIVPYVENVAASVQNVGILLTKFARANTVNGIKYYSSKHSK